MCQFIFLNYQSVSCKKPGHIRKIKMDIWCMPAKERGWACRGETDDEPRSYAPDKEPEEPLKFDNDCEICKAKAEEGRKRNRMRS